MEKYAMADDPALPPIELGGIRVWDATSWFPYKGDGGAVVFRPRTADQIEETAIHHDAVAFSGLDTDFDGSTVDEERDRMQASYNWHTKYWPHTISDGRSGWNWPGMGYHLYVFPSRRIYLVGDLLTVRAHVAYRNTRSIGIVGAGDFSIKQPEGLQVVAYGQAVAWAWLSRGAELPVEGHRVWAAQNPPAIRAAWSTACPGDTYNTWIPDVRRVAKQAYKVATTPPIPKEEDEVKLVQETDAPYVFVQSGVFYSYLHRMEDATEMGVPTVIESVAAGTLKSYVRADKDWMKNL